MGHTYGRAFACRFCGHAQGVGHNLVQGCIFCTCLATPSEANPRTDAELDTLVLRADQCRLPYKLRERYIPSGPRTKRTGNPIITVRVPSPLHIPHAVNAAHQLGWSIESVFFNRVQMTAVTETLTVDRALHAFWLRYHQLELESQ